MWPIEYYTCEGFLINDLKMTVEFASENSKSEFPVRVSNTSNKHVSQPGTVVFFFMVS